MKQAVLLAAIFSAAFFATASIAGADVPTLMQYQGYLADESGEALNDTLLMTFRIYDHPTEGVVIWVEPHDSVVVNNGLFNVLLGSVIPISDTVFVDTVRWLGITVDPDPEVVPRTRLVTVPYAFRTATVDGASGGDVYGNLQLHSYLYVGDSDGEPGQIRVTDGTSNTIIAYGSSGNLNIGGDLDVSGKATIGFGNTNTGADAFVAGRINEVSGDYATVGGGFGNAATDYRSTVGGGYDNLAGAPSATIAGGNSDTVSGSSGTIGGGSENRALGSHSSVGGGWSNTAGGSGSTVGGGHENSASNMYSTVGGGGGNTASGPASAIGGGGANTAGGDHSAVGGGDGNTASGDYSAVGGGAGNSASGFRSTISGGYLNTAGYNYSIVSGGYGDTASGEMSTVGGGRWNTASGMMSVVSGGGLNSAGEEAYSTVGGGYTDTASGERSTVSGGVANTASGEASTVSGGQFNTAAGFNSTISGGASNSASGLHSTVCGGGGNSNAGDASVIPGGVADTLTSEAAVSMAFGEEVYVNSAFRVVFFESGNSGRLGINRDDYDGGINHPIHVGTNTENGNGAYLSADGQWHDASSKAFKTDFHPLDGEEILTQISNVPVESWRYKGTQGWHIGPYAEDFAQAFGVGTLREDGTVENQYLAPNDVAGVALAGVKELAQQNQELRQLIEELRQRIAELEKAK